MTTTIEILKAARDLIAKPENWTQGSYYEVKGGNHCYCALGAIDKVSDGGGAFPIEALIAKGFLERAGMQNVADFNDSHTHSEVIDLFSKAISSAEEKQGAAS